VSEGSRSRGGPNLSPERLGEIFAHFAFYDAEPHAEILAALGYPSSAMEQVESGRARLRWALDGGIREGGIDELRSFVTAYDVVFRRLRSRRPRLSSAAIDPRLEPTPSVPPPRQADFVPLPKPDAPQLGVQQATPSYLVQPHLGVQVERVEAPRATTGAAPPPVAQPPAPPAVPPEAPAFAVVSNFTIMQSTSIVAESETLPFVQASAELVRPSPKVAEHVPTGTTAPSSASPMSLPFVAKQAAKEETKLRPEQIDLSLFPLELYAEISGGLARGDDRAKLLASRGLTDSLFDVLAQAWAKKLATDPTLMARFKELARQTASSGRRTP